MPSRASALSIALPVSALGALAFLAWRGVLELALLGWDSYPLILAGRVRDAAELWETFGEELMDGAYPLGRFWRPVVHLSFALDHALWGLEPAGYHATDLFLSAIAGAAVFLLARRLIGAGMLLGPLVAGIVYVLHPVQLEVLPVPARRAETLCVLFTLLALLAQPLGSPPRASGRAWLAGLCCALALASQETGAVATGLVVCLSLAGAPGRGVTSRLGFALRSAWPALVSFTLILGVRTAALGGLGGSEQSSLSAHLATLPRLLRHYLSQLVAPDSFLGLGREVLGDVVIVLVVAVLWRLSRSQAARPREEDLPACMPPRRAALFLVLAALVVALVTSVAGLEHGWYALPFLPLLALSIGLCVHLGLRGLRRGPRIAGAVALLIAARLLVLVALGPMRAAGLEPLVRGSREQQAFLERFDAALEGAAPGAVVLVAGLPTVRAVDPADPDSLNVFMLAPYSVQAYARLRFPDLRLRLGLAGSGAASPPGSDEVLVLLAP